jgi:3-oxoacyl-[acyl-carrier protein] reductase
MSDFVGKRIVITGGGGGIGVETARAFMQQGGHVLLVDVDEDRLLQAQAQLGPVRVALLQSALDTPAACAMAIDAAGGPVYALVHLAGLFEKDAMSGDDHAIWDRAIGVNLTSAYDMAVAFAAHVTRHGAPHGAAHPAHGAADRDNARIVLTSSVAYRRGSAGYPPYAAAKAGIVGLTRSLSRRLAPGILVNAVAPGLIDTRMAATTIAERGPAYLREIPLQRVGHPSEVATVIRFLCSADASYVTGQTITIDGGITNA